MFQFHLPLGKLEPESEPEGNQKKYIQAAPIENIQIEKTFYNCLKVSNAHKLQLKEWKEDK